VQGEVGGREAAAVDRGPGGVVVEVAGQAGEPPVHAVGVVGVAVGGDGADGGDLAGWEVVTVLPEPGSPVVTSRCGSNRSKYSTGASR